MTPKAFAAANTSATNTVPGTAGHLNEIILALTNADRLAVSDFVVVLPGPRVAAAGDTATGDMEVVAVNFTTPPPRGRAMAVLPEQDRQRAAAQWMRDNLEPAGFTKAQLKAALDATDNWIQANDAAFNAALPQPFRNAATAKQKTLLFCYVAMRREGLLPTQDD